MSAADGAFVVVGASLAGLRAVEAARAEGFGGPIVLVGAEPHPPYDRPPLSKAFLLGEAEDTAFRDTTTLTGDLGVSLRLGEPAHRLDSVRRELHVGAEVIGYDRLLIATGAVARPIPGVDLPGVHVLRTRDDAAAVRSALRPDARVVVIGGGFIGSEVAAVAHRIGAHVTIVEAARTPLVRAVGAMGETLTELHRLHGVPVRTGVAAEEFLGAERVTGIRLSDATVLDADLVVIGIGASPATGWLAGSGVELHALDGGVLCDRHLATTAPGVWAAGDVAHWYNLAFERVMRLENWTSAAQQGAHAARNAIGGAPLPYTTVPYYWSDWYDSRIQFVGVPDAEEVQICLGGIEENRLVALYRTGDRIVGALTVNQPRHIMKLRALIEKRAGWQAALDSVTATAARVGAR